MVRDTLPLKLLRTCRIPQMLYEGAGLTLHGLGGNNNA
jgi:hypothetical protein